VANQEGSTVDGRQTFAPDLGYRCVSQESTCRLAGGCVHRGVDLFPFGSRSHPFLVSDGAQYPLRSPLTWGRVKRDHARVIFPRRRPRSTLLGLTMSVVADGSSTRVQRSSTWPKDMPTRVRRLWGRRNQFHKDPVEKASASIRPMTVRRNARSVPFKFI